MAARDNVYGTERDWRLLRRFLRNNYRFCLYGLNTKPRKMRHRKRSMYGTRLCYLDGFQKVVLAGICDLKCVRKHLDSDWAVPHGYYDHMYKKLHRIMTHKRFKGKIYTLEEGE